MCKKELIGVAETSGLSRVPIVPEQAKGKAGNFISSPRDWYSGWSCMKTLITRGLVGKSSYPVKYMLTEKGKEVAQFIFTLNDPNSDTSLDSRKISSTNVKCSICSKMNIESSIVFHLTVREIKQWVVVDLAIDHACFIDKSQSLNIHFDQPNFQRLGSLHFYAWLKVW
ncbi:Crossover junction endonuclease mus81 [Orobanche hederae]